MALGMFPVGVLILATFLAFHGGHCYPKRGCHEKALEAREEEANVVMTGTVRELYPDRLHPNTYRGEVEIKRVFKGDNVIATIPGLGHGHRGRFFRKMVVVDGFGDPSICDSKIRRLDTRIFLLSKDGRELKLKSSPVRLTLPNIEQADAAVKGRYTYSSHIMALLKLHRLSIPVKSTPPINQPSITDRSHMLF